MCVDSNDALVDEEAFNASCINGSTDTNDELFMDKNLRMFVRLIFMGTDALSLICLLLPYMLTDKAKGTMLGRLMKAYCILSLLNLAAALLYTLMEFVVPAANAACCATFYLACYALLAAVISKVLFLFHICSIFYSSYKMVLKDTTEYQIIRLKVSYALMIAITPLVMILIITIHNHVIHEVSFTVGDRCLYIGDLNRFALNTVIAFIVCVHSMGVLIIIILTYLLRKAYQTQKAVGQDTKNLFRIALSIVVAFGMAWIVYAFQPLYSPVARLVFYSVSTIENVMIVSVLFYNNQILVKIKMYFMSFKCHYHKTIAIDNV